MKQRLIERNRARTEQAGFTLIELLIVIAILGILSAVVVFSVKGIDDRGEEAACKAEKNVVLTANEAYFAKGATVPPSYTDTAGLIGADLLTGTTKYWEATNTGDVTPKVTLPGTCV